MCLKECRSQPSDPLAGVSEGRHTSRVMLDEKTDNCGGTRGQKLRDDILKKGKFKSKKHPNRRELPFQLFVNFKGRGAEYWATAHPVIFERKAEKEFFFEQDWAMSWGGGKKSQKS